jgi:hypothetical protein
VHPKAPKAFPAVSGVFPSAVYAVLCGVRGRDNKRVPSSRYPQRYCSGVSIKGMEVDVWVPFCMSVPDWIDGIEGCEAHPHNTQTTRYGAVTYTKTRTRANYLMSPYAYSALGS